MSTQANQEPQKTLTIIDRSTKALNTAAASIVTVVSGLQGIAEHAATLSSEIEFKQSELQSLDEAIVNKQRALAAELRLKVKEDEEGILPIPEIHYTQINSIVNQFEKDITTPDMIGGSDDKLDVRTQSVINTVSNWIATIFDTQQSREAALNLLPLLQNGTYSSLTNEVYKLRKEQNAIKLERDIILLSQKYTSKIKRNIKKELEPLDPKIIISETFL